MTSIGTGYDLSASQFSPDGRVFQIEYAVKAVDTSSTVIGIRGKDCVVLGVEKLITSNLYEDSCSKRIFTVDINIGIAICGLLSDGRTIVNLAYKECQDYRERYSMRIPLKYLNDRISMYIHAYTLYSAVRPYGCSILIAGYEDNVPHLYAIDPFGESSGYQGYAFGKAQEAAKTEIEKLQFMELDCMDTVNEAARIIYQLHDEVKDKDFELELSWVGAINHGEHQYVPGDVFANAEEKAKQILEEESDSEMES